MEIYIYDHGFREREKEREKYEIVLSVLSHDSKILHPNYFIFKGFSLNNLLYPCSCKDTILCRRWYSIF